MLRALDILFFALHSGLILFNLLGWAWARTRRLHLISLTLTLGSWLGLGYWYGFGYCPLTDWHWRIREQLGDTSLPFSYLKFLIDAFTGWNVNAHAVDTVAVLALAIVAPLSIYLNVRDYRFRSRRESN